jgi:hypothetical protein
MHSSTFSFERRSALAGRAASAERLTAADRPGVAQPVPERPVPKKPWGAIITFVIGFVVLATAAWEWQMRALELLPGDLDDTPSFWAEERRRIDTENVQIAIVGDSRILFDTDLAHFETLTGVRPLQLALAGTNARPFLEDLAADADFTGLAIVGITEASYHRVGGGLFANALDRYRWESPAERSSYVLNRELSRIFGFLDDHYRLSTLVKRLDTGWRPGARGPYDDVWKLSSRAERRQTALWSRIETDPYLNEHARSVWRQVRFPPVTDEIIAMTRERTRQAVAAIRARGGEVIFVRPPSSGEYRDSEELRLPRARGWDGLLAAADVAGIHADDDPVSRELPLPELSHLSAACSTVYTDAYVRSLARLTSRLSVRADAPGPLSVHDCSSPTAASPAVASLRQRDR